MQKEIQLSGLSQKEASENLSLYGKNTLHEKNKETIFILFLKQFKSPFVYILLFVALISTITKEYTDAIVIFSVLVVNALVGTIQEYRANNAVSALKKLSQPKTKVIRDGKLTSVHTSDITVDDVVYLEPGDVVPADGIVISSDYLGINESSINGESLPVIKENKDEIVYKSTVVVSGKGFIKVEKVGHSTMIGTLALDMDKNKNKILELQKKISSFSFTLLIVLGVSSLIFFLIAMYRDLSFITTIKTIAAMGVAVIPEGLPIVITVVLSIGALQISKARALLRNLPSGATLASVSTICTDKTGTLTYGDVSVKEIIYIDTSTFSQEEKDSLIYHSLDIKNIAGKKNGDVLEIVMESFLSKEFIYKETKERPFTSESKFNAKEYSYNGKFLHLYKGASEVFKINHPGVDKYAKEGYRVLFVGFKLLDEQEEFSTENVLPLSLVIFEDKIREEVKESISNCKKTGIKIIMMTGDNILTAKHVAHEVGILSSEQDICLTGQELDNFTDEEIKNKIELIKVIARVTPSNKERIVSLLQEKGEVVAMTGDGVNDGPALSLADIGISMGKSGTDVAREASDLVLLNDDFSDIVLAIFQARTVAENIRKALVFLMTSASGVLVLIIGSSILNQPLPLLPVQILWLNFVTAGLLDVAIATENPEEKYASYTFKRYKGGLLNRYDIYRILVSGLTLGFISISVMFVLKNRIPIEEVRTALILLFSVGIWLHAFNVRKNYDTINTYSIFSNMFITFAVCFEALVLIGSIYSPIGNRLLHTTDLDLILVFTLILLGFIILIADYVYKKILSKKIPYLHSTENS
ncbi:MAG: cation-transporting P-type ATPase [Candidatus Pacebacteria bacterium]|nr:cation-transporting P-type ATPase [Candidatus Paceibacterota bacterium]MBP9866707.1 cation-transporting P-type ATPase [Candidatus Paceibacterota bacterium]